MTIEVLPVILAGGGGTRLWPLSREHYPKQFLALGGETTLLQQTFDRVSQGRLVATPEGAEIHFAAPLVVCNEEHRFLVAEQARLAGAAPQAIVLEPAGRNTAPALTVAARFAAERNPEALLLMMPADHVIHDTGAFAATVAAAAAALADGALATFGVQPTRPETGFGYIRVAASTGALHAIEQFVEKPDLETAERYLADGHYYWNSGMFLTRAGTWLQACETLCADIAEAAGRAFERARPDGDFLRLDAEAFAACASDSVDYAVMEKLAGAPGLSGVLSPLDAGWSDVGSWEGVRALGEPAAEDNVLTGDVLVLESGGNFVHASSRLVAMIGCRDLVVVETADAVLVVPRERAQDVKAIVAALRETGRSERLMHRRVYRPWGSYMGVDAGERFQVKRIVVRPGERLSLQLHHHRAEHWVVVRGTARVTRGDEQFILTENQSTYIPIGEKHRLENPGTIDLELIEVQSGTYLGEDDIVRFEDAYNRR